MMESPATLQARESIRILVTKIEDTELAVHLSLIINSLLRRLDELEELTQELAHDREAHHG